MFCGVYLKAVVVLKVIVVACYFVACCGCRLILICLEDLQIEEQSERTVKTERQTRGEMGMGKSLKSRHASHSKLKTHKAFFLFSFSILAALDLADDDDGDGWKKSLGQSLLLGGASGSSKERGAGAGARCTYMARCWHCG